MTSWDNQQDAKTAAENCKLDRLYAIANAVIEDICAESEIDDAPGSWYFVTPEQRHAIAQANAIEPVGSGTIKYLYDYELITTRDPGKTGRQRDAIEIVYTIDTYPSYPRVIPR